MKAIDNKKKLYFVFLIVFNMISLNSFSQDLTIITESNEISGDQFNGVFNFVIQNNTTDSLFVPLSPFKCEVVGDPEYCYSFARVRTFTSNRITFFKKSICYKEIDAINSISYLKFPKILQLAPLSKVKVKLLFEDDVINILKKDVWSIDFDLYYTHRKGDLNRLLNGRYSKFKEEFNKSLVDDENIEINTVFDSQYSKKESNGICDRDYVFKISDTTLYFYRDDIKTNFNYDSDYNFLLSYFWKLIK